MFKYSHGVLRSKLQAYENVSLEKPTIIKLVISCPALLVGDVKFELLQVLEKLRNLGVEMHWIRGCLSDKSAYNWSWILQMLNFHGGIGSNKNELAALIKK